MDAFLKKCSTQGEKLNAQKAKLRLRKVPFIGHIATDLGLCADPAKVRAITNMPHPANVAGVQRVLGMAQYLSEFLLHLSDLTKPLRDLVQKDSEWVWDHPQKCL